MRIIKALAATTALFAAVAVASPIANATGQTKSDVCHVSSDHVELISIADPAVESHLEHGDNVVGSTLPDGSTVGADCSIIPPVDPPAETLQELCDDIGGVYGVDGNDTRCDGLTEAVASEAFPEWSGLCDGASQVVLAGDASFLSCTQEPVTFASICDDLGGTLGVDGEVIRCDGLTADDATAEEAYANEWEPLCPQTSGIILVDPAYLFCGVA